MTSLFDPQMIAETVPPEVMFAILGNPALTEKEKARQLINYLAENAPDQIKSAARAVRDVPNAVFDTLLVVGSGDTTSATTSDRAEGQVSCVVCTERLPAVMLWPCRHVAFCIECSRSVRDRTSAQIKCPLCRAQVTEFIDVKLP